MSKDSEESIRSMEAFGRYIKSLPREEAKKVCLEFLQKAGIVDENEELTKPYRS